MEVVKSITSSFTSPATKTRSFRAVVVLLVVISAVVDYALPLLVEYTEIDWKAYMSEVEGPILHSEYDYALLKGDTGPLVYPAGFVYVFGLLWYVTSSGLDIGRAQRIFGFLHVILIAVVCAIYLGVFFRGNQQRTRTIVQLVQLGMLVVSKRIFSIFSLRLFNDGVEALCVYVATLAMTRDRYVVGCVFFSIAVSVKMNALLFAPGLAVLLLQRFGWRGFIQLVFLMGIIQLVLAAPFLYHHPLNYLKGSFDLSRVFLHEWSVNFQFLDQELFRSSALAASLLATTLLTWVLFGDSKWTNFGLFRLLTTLATPPDEPLDPYHVVRVMFESNFVGICFSRSIHYQFYVWYYHTLPFLAFLPLWKTSELEAPWRTAIVLLCGAASMCAIEYCYVSFPLRSSVSIVWHVAHTSLLVARLAVVPRVDTLTAVVVATSKKSKDD